MLVKIFFRRETKEVWKYKNPVLRVNELCRECDTLKFKIGDGKRCWNDLPYLSTMPEFIQIYNGIKLSSSEGHSINENMKKDEEGWDVSELSKFLYSKDKL